MTFSAVLDFDTLFGPPSECPDCGSVAVGIVHDHGDTRFHCRDCGTDWPWADAEGRASGSDVRV